MYEREDEELQEQYSGMRRSLVCHQCGTRVYPGICQCGVPFEDHEDKDHEFAPAGCVCGYLSYD